MVATAIPPSAPPDDHKGHDGLIFGVVLLALGAGGVFLLERSKGTTTGGGGGGGTPCTPPIGTLIGDASVGPVAGSRIWLVAHDAGGRCVRRWIANEYAFNSCDYAWTSITWLAAAIIDAIPEGADIQGFPDCPPAPLKPPATCVVHVVIEAGDTLPNIVQAHYDRQTGITPVPYFNTNLIWEALYAVNAPVLEAAAVAHGLVDSSMGQFLFAGTVLCLPTLGSVTPH